MYEYVCVYVYIYICTAACIYPPHPTPPHPTPPHPTPPHPTPPHPTPPHPPPPFLRPSNRSRSRRPSRGHLPVPAGAGEGPGEVRQVERGAAPLRLHGLPGQHLSGPRKTQIGEPLGKSRQKSARSHLGESRAQENHIRWKVIKGDSPGILGEFWEPGDVKLKLDVCCVTSVTR